jgi:hypothetical protein
MGVIAGAIIGAIVLAILFILAAWRWRQSKKSPVLHFHRGFASSEATTEMATNPLYESEAVSPAKTSFTAWFSADKYEPEPISASNTYEQPVSNTAHRESEYSGHIYYAAPKVSDIELYPVLSGYYTGAVSRGAELMYAIPLAEETQMYQVPAFRQSWPSDVGYVEPENGVDVSNQSATYLDVSQTNAGVGGLTVC